MIGIGRERLIPTGQRLLRAAQRGEAHTTGVERIGVVAPECERLVEAIDGLLMALERVEREPIVRQGIRRIWNSLQRGRDQAKRLDRLTLLELCQTQEMQVVELPDRK